MRSILLIFFGLFFCVNFAKATHLVGGELYYDCLGNNQYRITLKVYRDCGPANTLGTGFDQNAPIGIYSNGVLVQTASIPFPGSTNLPVVINNPCLQVPPNICIQLATYTTIVTLPASPNGYDIVYQRCCRSPAVQNVVTPGDYGNTYWSHIPSSSVVSGCNSSPRFVNYPPLVLCANQPFVFDHSALDPDGDVLEYEMVTPFQGGTPQNPAPNPPTSPPFQPIIWAAGYNVNNQIPGNPAIGINQTTGIMTANPSIVGTFAVGVRVKEFRNGVLINSTYRDFQFFVANCNPVTVASVPTQTSLCNGLTVNLNGSASINAMSYLWDFGDGNTSTTTNPSHTYAQPGTYTISLIVNAGTTCADTTTVQYVMSNGMGITAATPNPQCITNNNFSFAVNGNFDPAVSQINWNFGATVLPATSNVQNPAGVIFTQHGNYNVTVSVSQLGCTETVTIPVTVFPIPVIDAVLPPQAGCDPYLAQFQDGSLSWTPVEYLWTFGDGTFSTQANPTHLYDAIGVYDVTFTITVDSGCVATETLVFPGAVVVNPSPIAGFYVTPEESNVFMPDFEITDQAFGAIDWMYVFSNGDTLNFREGPFKYTQSGWTRITQIIHNEYGCPDTISKFIYIDPVTTIYVPNAFTPNGNLINEIWQPIVNDVLEYSVFVYNRWGNLIWRSEDRNEGWDGTFRGQKCPVDVYVYKIYYKGLDHIVRSIVGHVTLVR